MPLPSPPQSHQGVAYNQATASENRIHSDEVAARYGFRGGLVPGITVHAYLVEPALRAWGLEWLSTGEASILLKAPLYDGAAFRVEVDVEREGAYEGRVLDEEGGLCASGRVALAGTDRPAPPERRGDRPAPQRDERPEATRSALEALRERGLGAIRFSWKGEGEYDRTTRSFDGMHDLVRPDREGYANPGLVLGLANSILSSNVVLGPWIHVESRMGNHAAVPLGSSLITEARITDLFARGGHEFVDLDVAAYLESGEPVMTAFHRAIYRLREPT